MSRVAHQHDVAASAQAADEPPDRDPPDPGADLAPPLVALGALPHGDERVLQHVGDDLAVVAATAQPHRQPRGVPVVELPQRAEVAIGQSLEEGLVVGDDERCHTPTVDLRGPNGSPFAAVCRPVGSRRPAESRSAARGNASAAPRK